MRLMMKQLKYLLGFFAIIAISPFVLAKLGFWPVSFAQSIQLKEPYPPISYTEAPRSYSQAVERAAPSVVSVNTSKKNSQADLAPFLNDPLFRHYFGDQRGNALPQEPQPGVGSGVIISAEGHILTNNHVIKGADEIKVKLSDGRQADAKVIGSDPESDVAILKIELEKLPVIALADSDKLKPGDVVLAIGSPFGLGNTVSMGIVSATHRNSLGINAFESFIQTDAAINPGNSGGPLIDADGNMVGINNAIYTRSGGNQGIGFAIPINLARGVMNDLIDYGHVTRGWLGITVRMLSDDIRASLNYPKGDGAVIAGVIRGGPAHKAGLQPGDIIISLDGQVTKTPSDVLGVAAKLTPEKAYKIAIIRDGQTHDFRVSVGTRPTQKEESPKN